MIRIDVTEYLRNCPHCGNWDNLSMCKSLTDDYGEMYFVQCDHCFSRGPLCGSPKAAVTEWNNRPLDRTPDSCACKRTHQDSRESEERHVSEILDSKTLLAANNTPF